MFVNPRTVIIPSVLTNKLRKEGTPRGFQPCFCLFHLVVGRWRSAKALLTLEHNSYDRINLWTYLTNPLPTSFPNTRPWQPACAPKRWTISSVRTISSGPARFCAVPSRPTACFHPSSFTARPGTGKTTIAQVISHITQAEFVSLSAVLAGVADLREVIKNATERRRLYRKRTHPVCG